MSSNLPISMFRIPQEFYTLCYPDGDNKDVVIELPNNVVRIWKLNKDEWFSHKPICCWEIIGTTISVEYNDTPLYNSIWFASLLQYDQLTRHPVPDIQTQNELICKKCVLFNSLCEDHHIEKSTCFQQPIWKKLGHRYSTMVAFRLIHSKNWMEMDEIEHVFTLLAIRHNHNLQLKQFALKKLLHLINSQKDDTGNINGIYLRFLQATIWDIHNYKTNCVGYYNDGFSMNRLHNKYDDYIKDDIYKQLQTTQTSKYNDVIFKDIVIYPSSSLTKTQRIKNKKIYETCYDVVKTRVIGLLEKHYASYSTPPHIIVSLSGGVDSMLLSYMLNDIQYELQYKSKYKSKECVFYMSCVHISYNNRIETPQERAFVTWWCKEVIMTPLYIRSIDELTRNRCSKMRCLYETITRKIRFDMYRYVAEDTPVMYRGEQMNMKLQMCYVAMGHNKDDCFENVFTNLAKQIHFDNIFGMKEYTTESNINLWRPFLKLTKQDIYDCASMKNIPHLYDSTPDWSKRGQMRDTLLPTLKSVDANILTGLEKYVKYVNGLQKQNDVMFINWTKSGTIVYHNNNGKINMLIQHTDTDYYSMNYNNAEFWIKLWFHYDIPSRPSNKAIRHLIDTIQYVKERHSVESDYSIDIQLNKTFTITVYACNEVCIHN